MKKKLTSKQRKKLDANKDGKISGKDFAILRKKKKKPKKITKKKK